ncbi:MAG: lysophospholipid acyltransferase family protein [Bacteroidota bacterium]
MQRVRLKDIIEYIALITAGQILRLFPLRTVQRLGAWCGSVAFHIVPIRRRVALENLQKAFPEKTHSEVWRIARQVYKNFGIVLFEVLWFPKIKPEDLQKLVHVDNLQLMEKKLSEQKGLIMLSGHFGNWELLALAVGYLSGHPLSVIVQEQRNPLVNLLINRYRCRFGNHLINLGRAAKNTIAVLRKGGVVAMLADQSGPEDGLYVEFFGRNVATHDGPARFSLKTGAPLLMGVAIRQSDGTYHMHLEEVEQKDLPEDANEKVEELTRRHVAILERYIRAYPDHWLWLHRRWKHEAAVKKGDPSVKEVLPIRQLKRGTPGAMQRTQKSKL